MCQRGHHAEYDRPPERGREHQSAAASPSGEQLALWATRVLHVTALYATGPLRYVHRLAHASRNVAGRSSRRPPSTFCPYRTASAQLITTDVRPLRPTWPWRHPGMSVYSAYQQIKVGECVHTSAHRMNTQEPTAPWPPCVNVRVGQCGSFTRRIRCVLQRSGPVRRSQYDSAHLRDGRRTADRSTGSRLGGEWVQRRRGTWRGKRC